MRSFSQPTAARYAKSSCHFLNTTVCSVSTVHVDPLQPCCILGCAGWRSRARSPAPRAACSLGAGLPRRAPGSTPASASASCGRLLVRRTVGAALRLLRSREPVVFVSFHCSKSAALQPSSSENNWVIRSQQRRTRSVVLSSWNHFYRTRVLLYQSSIRKTQAVPLV